MTQPRDRVALDLETIPVVDDPDFDDPAHWIPFAAAVGYSDGGTTDVEVLFREDSTLKAEAKLLNGTIDWIADRANEGREMLTYNGASYDLPILKHRGYMIDAAESGVNVTQRLYLLLQTSHHVDLIEDMRAREGYWVSLDDALDMHDIESDSPEWLGKPVEGSDMPEMGLELLSNRDNSELRETVRRYAASDVEPLFELRESLRG